MSKTWRRVGRSDDGDKQRSDWERSVRRCPVSQSRKTASDERVQKGPASSADDDQQNEITLGWRTDGWPAGKAGKLTKPTYPGSLAKANEGEEQDRFRRT